MGQIFKKSYTWPMPPGAVISERDGQRVAQWRLRNGQPRSGTVLNSRDGKTRVRSRSRGYMARYRDGNNSVVEVATNCTDEVAARAVLTKLERRAEMVRSGVLTPEEANTADHVGAPLAHHLDVYERHLRAKSGCPRRITMVRRRIERIARECRVSMLNKMTPSRIEDWLVEQADRGMGAATRNVHREAIVGFGTWCRRTHRLTSNPFIDLPRADQNADRRHQRRALTEAELMRLLKIARLRPLAEFGRDVVHSEPDPARSAKSRKTWKLAPLAFEYLDAAVERACEVLKDNPKHIAELKCIGRERALLYRTMVLTGLRKGELASLTVGQLERVEDVVYAILNPADEKNRKGASIPLRFDLAQELEAWVAERLEDMRIEARRSGQPIPARLPASTPLLNVPSGLIRILNRDIAAAGIPKRDERDRVVDIHALRVTFGTHLARAGVPLRTTQAAMRHSKPELTANIYTDPKLLDVAGAIAQLPSFQPTPDCAKIATGTR